MSPRTNPENNRSDCGLIFNVQKFSLHDGTGIRTLVFLKGCPLTCRWCSNPEGQSYSPEIAYNSSKCIGTLECDGCMHACKNDAIMEGNDGKVEVDRKLCNNCGECVHACPSKAFELFGKYLSVDDVISVVEEDSGFYARSGGGLTVSGGEPLSQAGFVGRLLQSAQGRGLDTALETSGLCDWNALEDVCVHANQIFFDIKSVDPEKHISGAGVGNSLILENFEKLCETFPGLPIIVRTPVIPGFNDSPEDIKAIVDFLKRTSGSFKYELLPYHGFGEPKYRQLGKEYPLKDLRPPSQEHMEALKKLIRLDKGSLKRN